jgi:serine/threonine protein kinase
VDCEFSIMSAQYHNVNVGYNRFFIDQRYTNLKPIGDGSYGFVVSALDKVTGQKVAIKKIKDTFIDVVDAKRILRELKLLRHLSGHENIISILDIMSVPPNTPRFDDIYIVTNLMESDLERIIRSKQVLTNQHLQYFLYQILRGLKYVHSANILHRDLKPSNLLVNANCDLALCDFGLARGFETENKDVMTEYVVTRWYRSPELLVGCASYGKAVDIWSVGCIFAELLVHEPFFRGETPHHQLELIISKLGCPARDRLHFVPHGPQLDAILRFENRRPPPFHSFFPPNTSSVGLDLLFQMLQFNPDDRISVENALAHPYLKDFHGQMPEPDARSLFDFQFEQTTEEELPESEVIICIF